MGVRDRLKATADLRNGRSLCTDCLQWKPLSAFNHHPGAKNKCQTRCRSCARQRMIARNRKERLEVFAYLFGPGPYRCACCGTEEDLHLDHVYGDAEMDKVRSLGAMSAVMTQLIGMALRHDKSVDRTRYQILCRSCNISKGHNRLCKHDRERVQAGKAPRARYAPDVLKKYGVSSG